MKNPWKLFTFAIVAVAVMATTETLAKADSLVSF